MFQDAKDVADEAVLPADLCIIGAGAAGITIASELIGTGLQVCVVESGGRTYEAAPQRLHRGVNCGLYYEPLDLCRVRGFGGSTGPQGWGGWTKPLAALDFEQRPWVPLSGWPFSKEELDVYYRRAFATLSLPPETESIARSGEAAATFPTKHGLCEVELCPLSPAPHLGEVASARMQAAANVRVLLHANVTEIATDPGARTATGVHVATLNGKKFFVAARIVVLAAGGIENPRLLLLSNPVQKEGLGNGSDFVGRCFMEHPRFAWGRLSGANLAPMLSPYDPGNVVRQRRVAVQGGSLPVLFGAGLVLDDATQRREQLLGARSWILPMPASGEREAGLETKELVAWLMKRRIPSDLRRRLNRIARDLPNAIATAAFHFPGTRQRPRHWQFVTVMEQEPSLDSRVTLDDSRDALGLRRARVDWRLGPLTTRSLHRIRELTVVDLTSAGFDCSPHGPAEASSIEQPPRWVWHHMGTTRMSVDPRQGVVDAECRVHGIDNLYIAGSSVFPTGGNDMPTLTIVALAHRLADHLRARFARSKLEPLELVT